MVGRDRQLDKEEEIQRLVWVLLNLV
jgi:hypothetical protein